MRVQCPATIMTYLRIIPLMLCLAAAPATTPTTAPAPATAPAVELLDQGRVRIVPPAGWTFVGRGNDGLSLRYKLGGGEGVMTVIVNPQEAILQREVAAKMAKVVGQQLRDAARNQGAQFLSPPRVEPDERFLLKVRDRTRGADGKVRDQLQIYRAMQLELVHVAVVATVDTEEAARPIFAAAEELLDGAKLGSGPKPSSFRKTRVRLTIPTDWTEQRTDDPNGVVATYAGPHKNGARLVVRSKIIPKAARTNPEIRRNTIDQLMDIQRNAPLPDGATTAGDEQHADDARFARRVARTTAIHGEPWKIDFRCLVVGDVAIGVEALAPAKDFEAVSKLADEMALSIKSLDDKPPASDLKQSPAAEKVREDQKKQPDRPRLPPAQTPGIPGIPGLGF